MHIAHAADLAFTGPRFKIAIHLAGRNKILPKQTTDTNPVLMGIGWTTAWRQSSVEVFEQAIGLKPRASGERPSDR
jgi:hypothetical protein